MPSGYSGRYGIAWGTATSRRSRRSYQVPAAIIATRLYRAARPVAGLTASMVAETT
jgi:hypothetical protein